MKADLPVIFLAGGMLTLLALPTSGSVCFWKPGSPSFSTPTLCGKPGGQFGCSGYPRQEESGDYVSEAGYGSDSIFALSV